MFCFTLVAVCSGAPTVMADDFALTLFLELECVLVPEVGRENSI